jgi:sugar/nucleoside kinase (ribokinase family)
MCREPPGKGSLAYAPHLAGTFSRLSPGEGQRGDLMNFDVVVIGELNVDLLLYGKDVTPRFGQVEKLVDDATLAMGGSSAIFAHQAARLGLRVAYIGKLGADAFGAFMRNRLQEAGIDTSAIVVDSGVKTGLTVHLVRGADRAMLTYPGAIAALGHEEVDVAVLESARHVHVGSYFLQKGIQRGLPLLFNRVREAGATTSLDPGWDPEETWNSGLREVLPHTDLFLPNEQELLALARKPTLEEAFERFREVPAVVVKRGASGAVACGDGSRISCSPPPVEVVDTTGAGDSFDAGFVFGLLEGYDLRKALEIGCLCGALSTEKSGGVESQPDLERLRLLLDQQGEGKA